MRVFGIWGLIMQKIRLFILAIFMPILQNIGIICAAPSYIQPFFTIPEKTVQTILNIKYNGGQHNKQIRISPTHVHLFYACRGHVQHYIEKLRLQPSLLPITQEILRIEEECTQNNWYVLYHSTLPRYFAQHCIDNTYAACIMN